MKLPISDRVRKKLSSVDAVSSAVRRGEPVLVFGAIDADVCEEDQVLLSCTSRCLVLAKRTWEELLLWAEQPNVEAVASEPITLLVAGRFRDPPPNPSDVLLTGSSLEVRRLRLTASEARALAETCGVRMLARDSDLGITFGDDDSRVHGTKEAP